MRIYEFVKEHVIPFNSVIAMAVTVAAVLDFLAPQAAYLAWLSYELAGLVMLAMGLVHRFCKSFTFQPFGSRSSSIGSERVGHSSRRCL